MTVMVTRSATPTRCDAGDDPPVFEAVASAGVGVAVGLVDGGMSEFGVRWSTDADADDCCCWTAGSPGEEGAHPSRPATAASNSTRGLSAMAATGCW